jgi:Mn-dependent transcriptional regulator
MDFLRTIKEIYESTNLPVHYIRVAQLMGISKWSAYEMLKNLEREGFITSQYEVNPGEKHPGRAMVLFSPNNKLYTILSGNPLEKSINEWDQVKEKLLSLCEEITEGKPREIIKQLMKELPSIRNPMAFSAYILTILIALLRTLSGNSMELIKNIVLDIVNPESGIAMFAGAVIASIPKMAARTLPISQFLGYLSDLQKNLALLSQVEQDQLMCFLSDALAKTT